MPDDGPPDLRKPRRGRRRILAGAGLLFGLVLATGYFLFQLAKQRPNLYDPTRVALVEAQRTLGEAYNHANQEKALSEQLSAAHRDLASAFVQLGKAERLDPADKATIEQLRGRLAELEDDKRVEQMTDEELRRAYQEMAVRMQALIEKREAHRPEPRSQDSADAGRSPESPESAKGDGDAR